MVTGKWTRALIHKFVLPILNGEADYTKGNRFYDIETLRSMPRVRLLGNAMLSFITKFSSGYYHIFDPTNGYTALSVHTASLLPLDKINTRYFFESDILFRLNIMGAAVVDVPMESIYGDEESNLKIGRILGPFLQGHLRNFFKRIMYIYFIRGFSAASLELLFGMILLCFGGLFGVHAWYVSSVEKVLASSGTVMLSALPVILGVQLLLSFLHYDIANTPRKSLTRLFGDIHE